MKSSPSMALARYILARPGAVPAPILCRIGYWFTGVPEPLFTPFRYASRCSAVPIQLASRHKTAFRSQEKGCLWIIREPLILKTKIILETVADPALARPAHFSPVN